jgi:2-methylcitrate synthase
MSTEKIVVPKGLAGVVADDTSVSKVIPEINSLVYRGYKVQDLAEQCTFEEVAYLLTHDDLPNQQQLNDFIAAEKAKRTLSDELLAVIHYFPRQAHPMDTLRTAVSFLGLEDERTWESDPETSMDKFIGLFSRIPLIVAACSRHRAGKSYVPPRQDLSFEENFFYMCFEEVPSKEILRAFDVSMILYAEHSFNASTFASRVVTSTMSDMYSAVVGGIAALKGPLHGGANEQVMHMLKEIEDPAKAKEWMRNALATKRKVMGFGHRVYRNGDSRVPTMRKYTQKMAEFTGNTRWMETATLLEEVMLEEKGIYPNLDFPAGPAYYMMGFEIETFTPIFVISRVTGWAAHIIEQTQNNRIIRPLSEYIGSPERSVVPLEQRS